jgi:hypothetical protein
MLPTQPQDEDEVPIQPGEVIVSTSAVSSATSGSDSQQDFAEVTSSLLESDFDPSLLLSFEMLEPCTSIRPADPRSRAGHVPIYTLQPINSKPRAISSRADEDKEKHYQQSKVGQPAENKSNGSDHSKDEYLELEKSSDQKDTSEAEGRPCTPGVIPDETIRDHHQGNASCVTPTETPEPQRKRTAHRHARLIDGAIFPFKGRKSNATRGSVDVLEQLSPNAGRRSLFRLSWTPTRQNPNSRRSWLQGFKALFGSSQNNLANTTSGHRHKSSIGTIANAQASMLTPHKSVASNTAIAAQQSKPLGLSLDGAFDDLSSPSTSPLNKPLPLTPYEIAHSLSSGTRSASQGRSQSLLFQPPSASTTSTKVSETSSKREFQALANDLSGSKDCAMRFPELSPGHETTLNPRKYDPLKSPKPPTS